MNNSDRVTEARQRVAQLITDNFEQLENIAKAYAWRLGKPQSQGQYREMIDEIVQNAAVVALKKAEEFDPSRDFLPWINRICRYEALGYIRNQTRANYHVQAVSDMPFNSNQADDLSEAEIFEALGLSYQIEQEDGGLIEEILGSLNQRDRQLVEMIYINELPIKEVAVELQMKEGAIYTKLHRLRAKLKKQANN